MTTKICACCGQAFEPRPQVPNQSYCSSPTCQRARRQRWKVRFDTAITEALDRRVEGNGQQSDLGGLANRAIVGAVNDVLAPKLQSLFSSDLDTMRAALADLGKPKEFGDFSRRFFAWLANEGLQYFLSKVVNTQLGDGMRFATMNQSAQFNAALETHTREASVIVEKFSSEWFSKHRFHEGGDISRKSSDGFAGYALKKMKDELKAGARSDAR